jgi:mannose-6-phosphate isomerase-like protein (cupin superfamily)
MSRESLVVQQADRHCERWPEQHADERGEHEAYLVLEGCGVVTIDQSSRPVAPGAAVFIPGNAVHSIESTGETELRFARRFQRS